MSIIIIIIIIIWTHLNIALTSIPLLLLNMWVLMVTNKRWRGSFPGVKWPGRESDHSPSSAKVKNAWIYISIK